MSPTFNRLGPFDFEITEIQGGSRIVIRLSHADGIYVTSLDKGDELMDFYVIDKDENAIKAEAKPGDHLIELQVPVRKQDITEIRYLYDDTNHGGMIYNADMFPMSPFVFKLD
jgi:sialate O-acetylesterase